MLRVYHIGETVTVVATVVGKKYKYEYKRSTSKYVTTSTFSDSLEELEELYQKELNEENLKYE